MNLLTKEKKLMSELYDSVGYNILILSILAQSKIAGLNLVR